MAHLSALFLGFYLALHACYLPEFMLVYFGFSFPIVAGSGFLVLGIWLITGRLGRFFRTNISAPFVVMVFLWLLAAAVCSWKGYAVDLGIHVIRFYTAPIIFCGILLSLGLVRNAITLYALGFVVQLFFTWRYGVPGSTGRFNIPGTSMANPNDLAFNLLFGLAFSMIFLVKSNLLMRLFWFCFAMASLFFVLRTGSRANLITLLAMVIAAWIISSGRVRTLLIAGTLLTAMLFAVLVPRTNWSRLTTVFSASSEDIENNEAHLEGAISSTEARRNLQLRAIKISLLNPILGVGPRMFTYALDGYMRTMENYAKGSWQHPHNTYLDISSETGLPSLALYIGVIVWCLRTNYRNVRWAQFWPDVPGQALGISSALFLASVVYSVGTLFCSIPYLFQLPFLLGLTAANTLAMRDLGIQRYPVLRPLATNNPHFPAPRAVYGPVR